MKRIGKNLYVDRHGKYYKRIGRRRFIRIEKKFKPNKKIRFSRIILPRALKEWIYVFIFLFIIYTLITTHRDESKIESKIFELVNEERIRVGINSLKPNPDLNYLAKEHSIQMRKEFFFEHSNNNFGENIFDSPVYYWTTGCGMTITNNQIAKCMVQGWKESPGHYSNMINPFYSYTGIGVSCNIFECKATQNFK